MTGVCQNDAEAYLKGQPLGKFETIRASKYLVRGMEYSPLNKRSRSPYRFTQTSEVNGGKGYSEW